MMQRFASINILMNKGGCLMKVINQYKKKSL